MTKILLVEDDKSLREIYGVRLLAEGYDIVSAGDGEEALAMAIKEKPHLIISDVMMPKISGFDMLDILRSTTETRDIKVIMMTALSSDDQRNRGEQLGADKYLVKSQVGIEDVVRTVHEILDDKGGAAAPAAGAAAGAASTDDKPADDTSSDKPAEDASPAAAGSDDTTSTDDKPADDAGSDDSKTDSTDDTNTPKEDTDMPPVGDSPTPAASDDSGNLAAATPGNEGAGPLPPQPTELESSLPQPTAPFSSPRPSNLGENAMNPTDPTTPSVDPVSPAPAADVTAPVVPDLSAPAAPEVPVPPAPADLGAAPVEPVVQPLDVPAPAMPDLSAPAAPEVPVPPAPADDTSTPPAPGAGTPPVV